jgi:hypothetical protein
MSGDARETRHTKEFIGGNDAGRPYEDRNATAAGWRGSLGARIVDTDAVRRNMASDTARIHTPDKNTADHTHSSPAIRDSRTQEAR